MDSRVIPAAEWWNLGRDSSYGGESDLGLMVTDFLGGGAAAAGDSWCSRDSDSGFPDPSSLSDKVQDVASVYVGDIPILRINRNSEALVKLVEQCGEPAKGSSACSKVIVECAKSSRICKNCSNTIAAKEMRLGLVTEWYHSGCFPDDSQQDNGGFSLGNNKLFIGGICWETTEDHLRDYFKSYGEISSVVIIKDRATGAARGFGFINFADANVAKRVLLQKHKINGRYVDVKLAVPKGGLK